MYGVLSRLVPCLLMHETSLTSNSRAILGLYIYIRQVKMLLLEIVWLYNLQNYIKQNEDKIIYIYNNVCQIAGYNLGVLKKVVQLSAPGTIDTILNYGRCNIMNQGKPKVTRSRSEWIRKYVNYQSTFLFSDVMIFILLTMFYKQQVVKMHKIHKNT